jgi:hypothetical protein
MHSTVSDISTSLESLSLTSAHRYHGSAAALRLHWSVAHPGAGPLPLDLESHSLQSILETDNIIPMGDPPRTSSTLSSRHLLLRHPIYDPFKWKLPPTEYLDDTCYYPPENWYYFPYIPQEPVPRPTTPLDDAGLPTLDGFVPYRVVDGRWQRMVEGPRQEFHHYAPPSSRDSTVEGNHVPPFHQQLEDQGWDLSLVEANGHIIPLQEWDSFLVKVEHSSSTMHL